MLTEGYIEALLVDEELADQVWDVSVCAGPTLSISQRYLARCFLLQQWQLL